MSGAELAAVSLLLVAVAGLVVWSVLRRAKTEKERNRFLANAGFTPCDAEKDALAKKIGLLENNSEYTYSVRTPMKLRSGEGTAYFYTKERRRRDDLYVAYEFMFTVNRKKTFPFQVYLKPGSVKEGMATELLRSTVTGGWDTQADDLVKIDLPVELQKSNILGVMGPGGVGFHDLFDSGAVSLLGHAGDSGVTVIRCRGDICSIENPPAGIGWNYEKVWSFIRDLIRDGL